MKHFSCERLCLKDKFPKVEWLGQSPLLYFSFDRYCQIFIYPKTNIKESLFPHSLGERECITNTLRNSNEFLLLSFGVWDSIFSYF